MQKFLQGLDRSQLQDVTGNRDTIRAEHDAATTARATRAQGTIGHKTGGNAEAFPLYKTVTGAIGATASAAAKVFEIAGHFVDALLNFFAFDGPMSREQRGNIIADRERRAYVASLEMEAEQER